MAAVDSVHTSQSSLYTLSHHTKKLSICANSLSSRIRVTLGVRVLMILSLTARSITRRNIYLLHSTVLDHFASATPILLCLSRTFDHSCRMQRTKIKTIHRQRIHTLRDFYRTRAGLVWGRGVVEGAPHLRKSHHVLIVELFRSSARDSVFYNIASAETGPRVSKNGLGRVPWASGKG